MGLKALITVDLPHITNENDKREYFNHKLEELLWQKIDNLTTAWKVSFNDTIDHQKAISLLKEHINKAKSHSMVPKVYYAIQIGYNEIDIDKL